MGRRFRYHAHHKPYSAEVQMWAAFIFLGLVTGAFSYGIGLQFFLALGGLISLWIHFRK